MAEPILLIKKYANRRLYDTEQSRYITLDELATTVRGGRRVRIVDAKVGTDLTRTVLLQVILEEQDRLDMLPIELLHHLIRAQGTVQQAPFAGWLRTVYEQWSEVGGSMPAGWAPFAQAATGVPNPLSAMVNAWRSTMQPSGSPGAPPAQPPPPPSEPEPTPPPAEAAPPSPEAEEPAGPDLAAEARALRLQMDDLLKRLDRG